MSPADLVAMVLWLSVAIYAVLGGADFGGGVWDIFSVGPNGPAQRRVVADAMGPVWEANHVWLIFLIVGLFTGFPRSLPRSAWPCTCRSRSPLSGSCSAALPSHSVPTAGKPSAR